MIKNKDCILRIAAIKPSEFSISEGYVSSFYKLEKEQSILEENIRNISIVIENQLYNLIKKCDDNFFRKIIIKLKKRIKELKSIEIVGISSDVLDKDLKSNLNLYIQLKKEMDKIQKFKVDRFYISSLELHHLINIYLLNKDSFDKALSLSSLTYLNELYKFVENKDKKISNKKRNDLAISLYKYLTRASYKTSPFSFFCFQSNARFVELKISNSTTNIFNKKDYESLTSFSLVNSSSRGSKSYKINKNIWISNNSIEILKKENVNHRNLVVNNKNTLIKIEYDQFIEQFIVKNENKILDFEKIYNEILSMSPLPEKEVKDFIKTMTEVGILEIVHYQNLENFNPPKLKNISLENDRVNYLQKLKKEYSKIPKIYEDVYLREIVNIDSFDLQEKQIEVLNKLTLLFDDSVILKYKFIEYIGESKDLSMREVLNLLNDFMQKKTKISNVRINNIISLRNDLISDIQRNIKNKKETILDKDRIDELYKKMNYSSKKPFSYTFFVQPIENNSFVLNKVFSGYGRMFTRLKNSEYNQKIIKEMHSKILAVSDENLNFLDLYGLYGFNSNVHAIVTDYTVDLEDIFGGDGIKNISIQVNYEEKDLDFYFKGQKALPISLCSISSRMLPLVHRFLCDINHIDSMDLDLNRKAIYQDWREVELNKVSFIPRVKVDDIIISRNKWIINIGKYRNYNDEIEFYSQLIRDAEKGLIPYEFYARPIDISNISNLDQMNDIFKPQFVTLKIVTSYKLLFRIAKKSKFILLEECKPNTSDKQKYQNDFVNNTIELGVESYFIAMDNY